jgi:hypothetical protein
MPKMVMENEYVRYSCPGCGHAHCVPAKRWNFNGDLQKPTLSPSVRHFYTKEDKTQVTTCHYFIKNGVIEYCGDCQHDLKGKKIELPEIT